MELTLAEVEDVLAQPDITYPSPPHHGPGRWISVGGRLAIVHDEACRVITVLWRGQQTSNRIAAA